MVGQSTARYGDETERKRLGQTLKLEIAGYDEDKNQDHYKKFSDKDSVVNSLSEGRPTSSRTIVVSPS